jgi:hypothetical protein
MAVQTIRLPGGRSIKIDNLPEDMTQTRLKELLIRSGDAAEADFIVPDPRRRGIGATGEGVDVGQLLQENLDIPGSMGGAAMGAKIGTVGGPPGVIAGTILGGAIGTFLGDVASDKLTDDEVTYSDAVRKSLESIGFDVLLIGGAKALKKPFVMAKKALGFTPDETAEAIIARAREGQATGSPESLQATQKILTERGASLTRSQTGRATAAQVFTEKLGSSGLVSEKASLEQIQRVNDATREALTEVIETGVLRGDASPREVGESMYSIVEAGRQALSQQYGSTLADLSSRVTNKVVNTTPIKKRLKDYLKRNVAITTGIDKVTGEPIKKGVTKIDDATKDFVEDKLQGILELPSIAAKDLIDLDKALAAEIRKFGDINSSSYNTVAQAELAEVVDILKDSFVNTLKQADTKVAKEYADLKSGYKNARETLLPKVNANVIKAAERGDFDVMGKMLLQGGNVSKIRAFLGSIDEAYRQLDKGGAFPSEVAYLDAGEAKQALKEGFLKALFPDYADPTFSIDDYAKKAREYDKPAKNDMLKTMLGKDYKRTKQLMNLFSEASQRPDGNIGTLFLRGKEYESARQVGRGISPATIAGTAGAGFVAASDVVTGGFTLAAVLMTPVFLAKASSNPKAVNRLLAFEKQKFDSSGAAETALASIVDDVVRGMNEYEAAQFRSELENQ